MRKLFITTLTLVLLSGAAQAEMIHASVNGLVCSFCATSLEKIFLKQAAVEHVMVDLESKQVSIHTKPQQTLDDATITKLITDAGYSVTNITREK